jgi:hypothetical protein
MLAAMTNSVAWRSIGTLIELKLRDRGPYSSSGHMGG